MDNQENTDQTYELFDLVSRDIENGVINRGVWAKAFSDTNGQEQATKALYMKLMVERALQELAQTEVPKVTDLERQHAASPAVSTKEPIASLPEKKPKLDWNSMPWVDIFALAMLGAGAGAFIAGVVTTLAMGMSVDITEILFARTTGPIYLAGLIGFFMLLRKGYFRRSGGLSKERRDIVSVSREEPFSQRTDTPLFSSSDQKLKGSRKGSNFNLTAALALLMIMVAIIVLVYATQNARW